jgi:hypothetical protein
VTPCVVDGPNASGTAPTFPPVLIAGLDVFNTGNLFPIGVDSNGGIIPSGIGLTLGDGVSNNITTPAIGGGTASQYETFPNVFNGGSWNRQFSCTRQGTFGSSSSGDQQIIALSGGTNIRLCTIDFSSSIPEGVKIDVGTGANCGTGTTTLRSYTSVTAFDFEWGPLTALLGGSGNAICINPAVAQAFTVNFTYAQF